MKKSLFSLAILGSLIASSAAFANHPCDKSESGDTGCMMLVLPVLTSIHSPIPDTCTLSVKPENPDNPKENSFVFPKDKESGWPTIPDVMPVPGETETLSLSILGFMPYPKYSMEHGANGFLTCSLDDGTTICRSPEGGYPIPKAPSQDRPFPEFNLSVFICMPPFPFIFPSPTNVNYDYIKKILPNLVPKALIPQAAQ